MRTTASATITALALVACGSTGTTPESISTVPATTTTTTDTSPTSSPGTTMSSTTTAPATQVQIADGEVSGPDQIEVELGDTVGVRVLSDVNDELHVHGYDLVLDLEAGVPLELSFTADIPGVFEVELHTDHTLLFEIRVLG